MAVVLAKLDVRQARERPRLKAQDQGSVWINIDKRSQTQLVGYFTHHMLERIPIG